MITELFVRPVKQSGFKYVREVPWIPWFRSTACLLDYLTTFLLMLETTLLANLNLRVPSTPDQRRNKATG